MNKTEIESREYRLNKRNEWKKNILSDKALHPNFKQFLIAQEEINAQKQKRDERIAYRSKMKKQREEDKLFNELYQDLLRRFPGKLKLDK